MTGQDKREGAAAPSSARADLLSDACAELDAPGWVLPLLREYEAHRREKKAGKLTLRGWKAKVKDAVVHGEGPVRAAVRLSVSNGWTGLFPEKCAESANQGPSAGRQPRSLNQQQRNRLYAEAQRAFSDAGNGTAHSNSDLHRWLWVTGHPHAALLDPEAIDAP